MEKEKQKKEHILVCLSSSPSNEKIIRTAAQMAQAFQAGFTALYVQTAEKTEKTPEDLARLQKHVRLAEQSGAEIVTTHSEDIALQIAARVKARRLELNLTQEGLASRAGVKFATYRRFEQTGEISLRGLLQVGFALNCLDEFNDLFAQKQYQSLDDVLNEQRVNRKRGKKNE